MLARTVKPCGPDAELLASSSAEAMFGLTGPAKLQQIRKSDGGTAVHRGERGVSRKTIVQGKPGEPGLDLYARARFSCFAYETVGATRTRLSLRPLITRVAR